MENHHAINGKTHYIHMAIFNSELLVIPTGLLTALHLLDSFDSHDAHLRCDMNDDTPIAEDSPIQAIRFPPNHVHTMVVPKVRLHFC